MMAKQVEGFVFHLTQLEESNKENCSINCNAAFSTRKRQHLGYIAILQQPKSLIISTFILGYYITKSQGSRWHEHKKIIAITLLRQTITGFHT